MLVSIDDSELRALRAECEWARGMKALRPAAREAVEAYQGMAAYQRRRKHEAREERRKADQRAAFYKAQFEQFARIERLVRDVMLKPPQILAELESLDQLRIANDWPGHISPPGY